MTENGHTGTELVAFAQLSIEGVQLTPTSLRVTDPDLSYDDFVRVARETGRIKTATSWWLGDLLNFGEKLYDGDRYATAMELSGLAYETLSNYSYVCRRVAMSRRRDRPLRFGHHAEVAPLEPAAQIEWLDAALANAWTRTELRAAIRDSRDAQPAPEQPSWTSNGAAEVLTPTGIAAAVKSAERVLARPLAEGHPLWRTQAETSARDVLSLALTVAEHPPAKEAAVKVMEQAVVDGDGYRVPREPLDALLRLVLDGDE